MKEKEKNLLKATKVLIEYTTGLLQIFDGYVVITDVEELEQAKDAIAEYNTKGL